MSTLDQFLLYENVIVLAKKFNLLIFFFLEVKQWNYSNDEN